MSPLLQGVITIIVGVFGCVGYFYAANLILDKVIFPARGPQAGRNINRATAVRPWLFLFPAIFALSLIRAWSRSSIALIFSRISARSGAPAFSSPPFMPFLFENRRGILRLQACRDFAKLERHRSPEAHRADSPKARS